MKIGNFWKEFRKQSSIAIVAAFGFLIALSWRDFISEVVTHLIGYFSVEGYAYLYKLIAAVLVTLVSIVGIMIASKMNVPDEVSSKKKK